jgi:hypothetical protein
MRYRNTGGHRVWPTLTDELTGRTLELDPGQECELADEVSDPYLEVVGAQALLSDGLSTDDTDGAATIAGEAGEAVRAQLIADVAAEKVKLAADEATLAQ